MFTYLRDVGQSNDVRDEADDGNENLAALPQNMRELVYQCGDEAFHGAELEE